MKPLKKGVLQEIYALLLAQLVMRTLMHLAAEQAQSAPTQISFTETIRVMDEDLLPLGLVQPARRQHMVAGVLREMSQQPRVGASFMMPAATMPSYPFYPYISL